jgi:cytochrome c oxidase assembly factor CtaG
VHALGERMFSFHMLQHVLLGDLAPLALLGGLTGPILPARAALAAPAALPRQPGRRAAALGGQPLPLAPAVPVRRGV